MSKRIVGLAASGLLIFVFLLVTSDNAPGQGVGIYRGKQGRRIGRVTLPTPPFNPNAGILEARKGRGQDSPKTIRHRPTRAAVKATKRNTNRGTARGRGVRRGRNTHPGTPRGPVSHHP